MHNINAVITQPIQNGELSLAIGNIAERIKYAQIGNPTITGKLNRGFTSLNIKPESQCPKAMNGTYLIICGKLKGQINLMTGEDHSNTHNNKPTATISHSFRLNSLAIQ